MALKFAVKSLDEVPENVRPLYVKDDTSGEYRLPVEGVVPKSRLDEFRDNNISIMRERDELKTKLSNVDLDEYVALKTEAQKNKDKKLIDENKIEELLTERVGRMKTEYDGKVNNLTVQLSNTTQQLERVLIDSELQREAVAGGVLDTGEAISDVIRRGREVYRLKDGKAIPMEGDKVIYGADGITPLPIKEWVAQLAGKASYLFKQSKGGGASSGGVDAGGGTVSKKSDLKSPADKAGYIGKHGRDKYLALPA